MNFAAPDTTKDANPDHYRIMVVDDSAVIRGLVTRFLEAQPGIKVVASYANGRDAVNAMERSQFDVIVLDIEMPIMDGLTALPLIIEAQPTCKVLISSTLTRRNADISLECLEKGASDYIPKPEGGTRDTAGTDEFFHEMHRKILALGAAARQAKKLSSLHVPSATVMVDRGPVPLTVKLPEPRERPPLAGAASAAVPKHDVFNPALATPDQVKLRPWPNNFKVDAVAIGSSTGGPQALFAVLKHLKGIRQPIFLTQHMPPTFTAILSDHINRQTGVNAMETKGGEVVEGGKLYLAPGGHHMLIERNGAQSVVRLDDSAPENFCRPAVDPMLRSLVPIYGNRLLTIILTGMGHDGLRGAEKVVAAGGAVMAQDAATSVVWGMPGAVATAGVCSAVLPLNEIGPEVLRMVSR